MVSGMGLAKKSVVLLVMVVMAVCGVSMGAVYKVGDSAGWTTTGHVDYKTWSASKTFHVGDTILFEYNKQFNNVIRVTHKNFNACNGTAPYLAVNSGNDSFTIKRGGHFYFICSIPGHCEAGQKVDMRVPRSSPVIPASPPPSSSPTPAPHHQPAQSPFRSASPGPSPSPCYEVLPPLSEPDAPVPKNSASSLPLPKGLPSGKLWLSVVVLALSVSSFAY